MHDLYGEQRTLNLKINEYFGSVLLFNKSGMSHQEFLVYQVLNATDLGGVFVCCSERVKNMTIFAYALKKMNFFAAIQAILRCSSTLDIQALKSHQSVIQLLAPFICTGCFNQLQLIATNRLIHSSFLFSSIQ